MALLINPYRFASTGFDPASLFQGGTYKGYWLDISDISTLKQSIAGTTAVTADGDRVGYVADKSGASGAAWVAAADTTTRPVYKTTGGKTFLSFTTTEDNGLIANSSGDDFFGDVGSWTLCIVGKKPADNSTSLDYRNIIDMTPSGWSRGFGARYYGNESFLMTNGDGGTNPVIQGSDQSTLAANTFVFKNDNTTPSTLYRKNKTEEHTFGDTGVTGNWASGTPPVCAMGYYSAYAWLLSHNYEYHQVFFINRALTGTDLTDLETELARRAGVTI
jgi:hypothetical protein